MFYIRPKIRKPFLGISKPALLPQGSSRHAVADAPVGVGSDYEEIVEFILAGFDKILRINLYAEPNGFNPSGVILVRHV